MAYIAPTYTQAKRIAWATLKEIVDFLPKEYCKFNEAELKFTFDIGHNKFTIYLLGSERYDTLRGIGLYRAVLDEYGDMNTKVWTEVVYPTLLDDDDSRALFIGTPKGSNHFKDLYDQAAFTPKWERFHFDINESGVFTKEQIEEIQEQYKSKPEAYNQEFLLSWQPSVEGSIYLDQIVAARNTGRVGQFTYDNRVTVSTAWDIGIADDTTLIFFQQVGTEVRIIDVYANRGKGMDHYIDYVNKWRDLHNAVYDRHFAPHDIQVREFSNGKSRYETARQLGMVFTVGKKLGLEDGINAVRQMLPNCYFDEATTGELLDALCQYHRDYDDKNEVYKSKPVHDKHSHFSDAFRYLAMAIRPIRKKSKGSTDAFGKGVI